MKYDYNKIVIYFKDNPEDRILYAYLTRYKNVSSMCKKLISAALSILNIVQGVNIYAEDQEVQDQ